MNIGYINRVVMLLAATLYTSCSVDAANEGSYDNEEEEESTALTSPNILFILIDDLGVDALNTYSGTTSQSVTRANTPNIDKLAARGITFDNAWSSPLSAPTRASVITGKYGDKTGVMALNPELSTNEVTLHAALSKEYATSLIGKWHLTKDGVNPELYGMDYFAGMTSESGVVDDYFAWNLTQNGVSTPCNDYATTKITDLTIEWISEQQKPWFCWVATIAPHAPYHLPPSYMHSQGELPSDEASIETNPLPYFLAMVESVDYEVGRLLESLDDETLENTTIILMGDNGTSRKVIQAPYTTNRSKGTLFEGGVRVPLIVAGAEVSNQNSRSDILITATDIFATVMELSGEELPIYEDSYSFADVIRRGGTTQREYSFTEVTINGSAYSNTIRNQSYKLFTQGGVTTGFYKIAGYTEGANLIDTELSTEASLAFEELSRELERMNIPNDL
ncbi:MAG: sulfatase-like hydrolase/transferase [Rikenellaceae bacterium]